MANPDFNELIKKAEEMQSKMKDIQEKIAAMFVTGSAGADLVTIKMNGQHKVKPEHVFVDPSLLTGDKETLEHLIASAINDASDKVETRAKGMLSAITNEFKLDEESFTAIE